MRVAIVHDWFIGMGGAEQVVKRMLEIYPDADVYCLLDHLNATQRDFILQGKNTHPTYLQSLPNSKRFYKLYLPLFARAIETIDLSGYDLVLSSSHAVAKGVRTGKNQMHICYCHTPVRYAWDLKDEYLSQIKSRFLRKTISNRLERLRKWDLNTAKRVDYFISNSHYIADRIKNNYNRSATTIHPPIDTELFRIDKNSATTPQKPYALVVSRLVPYKKTDLIINAFAKHKNIELRIIGTGPMIKKLKKSAGENVSFMGFQPYSEIVSQMQNAAFMVMAANEDFGITSLESQACGTPVLAYRAGGYLETVIEGETGHFFAEQTETSIANGIVEMQEMLHNFDKETIRKHALKFGADRFKSELKTFIDDKLAT